MPFLINPEGPIRFSEYHPTDDKHYTESAECTIIKQTSGNKLLDMLFHAMHLKLTIFKYQLIWPKICSL